MEEWQIVSQSVPFWRAIPQAFGAFGETFVLYKNGIITLIIGAAPATMVGPVGMVQMTAEVAEAGISPLLEFAAMLSLLIAIFQLFPLPALDGGRVVFILLEWDTRDNLQQFAQSDELKERMQRAGVIGPPDINFINLADSPSV